jgi:hypothetical protein
MRARSATPEDTPRRLASRESDEDEENEDIDLLDALDRRRSQGQPRRETTPDGSVVRRVPLDPAYIQHAQDARKALAESFGHDASAPERLLLDMIAAELPVHSALVELEVQIAARLPHLMDNARHVRIMATALREVVVVSHAIGRRVENLLGSAVGLRAQRRLVDLHRSSGQ